MKKMKKWLKRLPLFFLTSIVVLALWNLIHKKIDQSKLESAYGQVVEVGGKDMVVDIKGEKNDTTIILLPGWGCVSPILEFCPISDALAENFKVITIEPFGYGLSDKSEEGREVEVIVEELHECVQKLGCEEYYLMAHSLSGVYSLYWSNEYPKEVKGFIGIDCSVPKQIENEPFPISMITINRLLAYGQKLKNVAGITRLTSISNPKKAFYADASHQYSEKEVEIYRILSIDHGNNKTVMNELKYMEDNMRSMQEMKFPEHIPVLHFISDSNCKLMESWERLHKEIATENIRSETIRMEGGHYLHFEQKEEIVKEIKEWIIGEK